MPSDPTSAHWYNVERFENLMASYVAAENDGGRARTVREFVSEFRGLSSTVKQKKVTGQLDLSRAYLRDLVVGEGKLDRHMLSELLHEMQASSNPPRSLRLSAFSDRIIFGNISAGQMVAATTPFATPGPKALTLAVCRSWWRLHSA